MARNRIVFRQKLNQRETLGSTRKLSTDRVDKYHERKQDKCKNEKNNKTKKARVPEKSGKSLRTNFRVNYRGRNFSYYFMLQCTVRGGLYR